jgi:prepilin-type N-terminal cleavage/methylation domain-containing protein
VHSRHHKEEVVKRKGFTLIELMVVIAIIIILAAIAIPNYLKMTERAKRSRVASDFAAVAIALEAYRTDWGYYPKTTVVEFGKQGATIADSAMEEQLIGTATADTAGQNRSDGSGVTSTGEKSPIEYLKASTLRNFVNPFYPGTDGYYYASTTTGTNWKLAAKFNDTDIIFTTDVQPALQQVTGTASSITP